MKIRNVATKLNEESTYQRQFILSKIIKKVKIMI